jgi:hypothetical protein
MTAPVTEVRARPVRTARLGWALAAVVFVCFTVTAVLMRRHSAGATFGIKDQLGTFGVGIILAGLFVMLTRPRLEADLTALRMRAFLGGYRVVPWDVVIGVEFRSKNRFARVLLPADEYLTIYAVQRWDPEQSVVAMDGLRALFAATHPATDG